MVEVDDIRTGEILSRSFALCVRHPALFGTLAFLSALPSLTILVAVLGSDLRYVALFPLWALLKGLWLALGSAAGSVMTQAAGQSVRGLEPTLSGSLQPLASRPAVLLGLSVTQGLLVLAGAALLLVPGAAALARLWVAAPAAVEEQLGITGALQRSHDLTLEGRGQLLGVAALLLLFEGMTISLALLPFWWPVGTDGLWLRLVLLAVVAFGFQPFWAVAQAVSYHALRLAKEGGDPEQIAQVFE